MPFPHDLAGGPSSVYLYFGVRDGKAVGSVPIGDGDVLDQHCFRRLNGEYLDECSNQLPGPVEPVGDFGLHSFRTIDDEISDALGFDRVPD